MLLILHLSFYPKFFSKFIENAIFLGKVHPFTLTGMSEDFLEEIHPLSCNEVKDLRIASKRFVKTRIQVAHFLIKLVVQFLLIDSPIPINDMDIGVECIFSLFVHEVV